MQSVIRSKVNMRIREGAQIVSSGNEVVLRNIDEVNVMLKVTR